MTSSCRSCHFSADMRRFSADMRHDGELCSRWCRLRSRGVIHRFMVGIIRFAESSAVIAVIYNLISAGF